MTADEVELGLIQRRLRGEDNESGMMMVVIGGGGAVMGVASTRLMLGRQMSALSPTSWRRVVTSIFLGAHRAMPQAAGHTHANLCVVAAGCSCYCRRPMTSSLHRSPAFLFLSVRTMHGAAHRPPGNADVGRGRRRGK